mmetsp:Transcript_64885/g.168675  ORF Transcript_64885/g.168675 Transcript_64885/m.168675 type:complete len:278 (+) Transcript_64885:672-1505(+)
MLLGELHHRLGPGLHRSLHDRLRLGLSVVLLEHLKVLHQVVVCIVQLVDELLRKEHLQLLAHRRDANLQQLLHYRLVLAGKLTLRSLDGIHQLRQRLVGLGIVVLELPHLHHRRALGVHLALLRRLLGVASGKGVAAVRIAVDLHDPARHGEVEDLVAGLLQEPVVVRDLGRYLLLVVGRLGVEKLAKDLREGLHLLLRQVLLELVRLAELFVELPGRLGLHHLPLLGSQRGPPGLEVLLEATHGCAPAPAMSSGGCSQERYREPSAKHAETPHRKQ